MKAYTEAELSTMSIDEIYEKLHREGETKEEFFRSLGFKYNEPDNLFRGVGKSILQGMTSFPKTFYGIGAVMEDLAYQVFGGSDEYEDLGQAGLFRQQYENARGYEERFQSHTEGWKRYINEAVKTIAQMGSHALGTAGVGALPSIATGSGVEKYLEARNQGTGIASSLSAGVTQGLVEYGTEQPFYKIIKQPGIRFLNRLGRGLVADVPGELIATVSEMKLVDEKILGKSYTIQEYTKALLDTMVISGLTTTGVTTAVHPFVQGRTKEQLEYEKYKDRTGVKKPGMENLPGGEITPEAEAKQIAAENKKTFETAYGEAMALKLSANDTYREALKKVDDSVLETLRAERKPIGHEYQNKLIGKEIERRNRGTVHRTPTDELQSQANELYTMATPVQQKLKTILTAISQKLGLGYKSNQKSIESIVDKVARKAKGNPQYNLSSLKDITRGVLLLNDYSQLPETIKLIEEQLPGLDKEIFIANPLNKFGYKGIHLNTKIDGISAEIQIHTKESWQIKEKTDEIYREWRNKEKTSGNEKEYLAAQEKSTRLWSDYFDRVLSNSATSELLKGIESITSPYTPSKGTQPSSVNTLIGPEKFSPTSNIISENSPDVNRENLSEKPSIEQPPKESTEINDIHKNISQKTDKSTLLVTQAETSRKLGEKLVEIDVDQLNALWQKDPLYIEKGEELRGNSIEAPSVKVTNKGASFIDGRHRFASARDAGIKKIQVAMDEESVANAKNLNIIETNKSILNIVPAKDGKFNLIHLTPFQTEKLKHMQAELREGYSTKGGLVRDEEGNVIKRYGTTSTYPEYFTRKGYSSEEVNRVINRVLQNSPLTARQTNIIEDLLLSKIERERDLAIQYKDQVVIGELGLKPGDSFEIAGEKFTVIGKDSEDNFIIKDGETFIVDATFGTIPEPDEGSIQRSEVSILDNLSPKLKPLIESGELSLQDANDIASLNLPEDQQEYFYYNLIKPNQAILIDKDQASLRAQYTAYRKMQDVLKLGKDNEQIINILQNQIDKIAPNLKIEGGVQDKFEMILNNTITAYNHLKPEELIIKVQEELALNLNRINASMDTKTLMAATLKAFKETTGKEKETITHEQTKQEALKELPTIHGKVMGLKPGQTLTRPQQLAARILGNTLTELLHKSKALGKLDPTNQALYKQTVDQFLELGQYLAKVTQSSSEMGRELEALKIIAEYSRDTLHIDEVVKAAEQIKNSVPPEQFYRMLDELKTEGQIKDAAEGLARHPSMFIEYWINALLSNPMTHATNILSNMYTTFAGPVERALAARLHFGQTQGVVPGEAQAMLYGLQSGFLEALRIAGKSLRTGESQFRTQKVENARQKAITANNLNARLRSLHIESELTGSLARGFDMLGKSVRMPTRLLMTMDDFFKAINYRMESYAQAFRQIRTEGITDKVELGKRIVELVNNPTEEIKAMAENFAQEQTFTNEPGVVGKALLSIVNKYRYGRIILPFISTPENIFRYTVQRTPILNLAAKQTRADLARGGTARDMALGKMALGGIVMASVAMLTANGFITGGGPDDPELKQMLYAKGWQPYAIKIGDTYYSFKRIDPIGSLFGLVADFVEVAGELDEKDLMSLGTTMALSVSKNIVSKTYLQGVTNIIEAVMAPNKRWHEYMKRQIGSLVPAGSAGLARAVDPVMKETETIMDAVRARIPGYSKDIPPRRNIFGDKIVLEGGLGPDAISPIYTTTDKNDPVIDEIVKQGVQLSMPSKFMGGSSFSQTDPTKKELPVHGVPLEPDQYDKLVRYTGEGLKDDLADLFRRQSYQNASNGPYGGKALKILNIVNRHKDRARERLLREETELADKIQEKKLTRRQLRRPMMPEPMSSMGY